MQSDQTQPATHMRHIICTMQRLKAPHSKPTIHSSLYPVGCADMLPAISIHSKVSLISVEQLLKTNTNRCRTLNNRECAIWDRVIRSGRPDCTNAWATRDRCQRVCSRCARQPFSTSVGCWLLVDGGKKQAFGYDGFVIDANGVCFAPLYIHVYIQIYIPPCKLRTKRCACISPIRGGVAVDVAVGPVVERCCGRLRAISLQPREASGEFCWELRALGKMSINVSVHTFTFIRPKYGAFLVRRRCDLTVRGGLCLALRWERVC